MGDDEDRGDYVYTCRIGAVVNKFERRGGRVDRHVSLCSIAFMERKQSSRETANTVLQYFLYLQHLRKKTHASKCNAIHLYCCHHLILCFILKAEYKLHLN